MNAIGAGISMQQPPPQSQQQQPPPPQQQQQNMGNAIVKPPSMPQILTPSMHHQQMHVQADRMVRHTMGDQPQMMQHQMSNHLNIGPNMAHAMNNNGGLPTIQMTPSPMQGPALYETMHPNMMNKPDQQQSQLLQPPQLNALPPQNQYMQNRNATAAVSFAEFSFIFIE